MDIKQALKNAKEMASDLAVMSDQRIREILYGVSQEIEMQIPFILQENQRDLDKMDPADPKYDRLKLTSKRIHTMVQDLRKVIEMDSPVGKALWETKRPNGMHIRKVVVPFGVVGIIYEARPNVTLDVFGLCLRTRNVCVLKGGSDAQYSNQAIVSCIYNALPSMENEKEKGICTLLPPGHEASLELLHAVGLVDVIIPRGSKALIDYVRQNAQVPVIETGAGVCHTYIDIDADIEKARAVVTNAKTRRVSVCNALDCLLIHIDRLNDLPDICRDLAAKNVIIYADSLSMQCLKGHYPDHLLQPATEKHYGHEFLDYKMSIQTVMCFEAALAHISLYGSRHSECMISENQETIKQFLDEVDAACVYANVSTAFTDGGQFGFGAEVGISTQKLHARGPMGLEALTTYKYQIIGNGQTRNQ
ncbi:glutamate-5-semialdehyde dehydrogenase [Parabacteroides pacaensis]|uniref:glutamate-5-semialdehyde dehydrogenase n=1 Tax=Parabacteroides pacaensis TaxID=2086575 RepID=UPI000D10A0A5|nr:glutamate-5-semialdehyde dehydrogenase [Parabacteroides pacaensis]